MNLRDPKPFINAICSPHVAPFLSRERLIKSEQFSEMMNYCDEHFDTHRDTRIFSRLLDLFDGYPSLVVLADYLRIRHGVQITRDGNSIKVEVQNASTASPVFMERMTFAKHHHAGKKPGVSVVPKNSGKSARSKKLTSSKEVWQEGYVDALDHPARLPGSFGHGRVK